MEENCFIRKNTPEHKDLLLKDLCSRLPYGVNVEYTFKVAVIATNTEEIITKPLYLYSINTLDDMTVSGIDNDGYENICFFEEVKPYLFPLSSLTNEQIFLSPFCYETMDTIRRNKDWTIIEIDRDEYYKLTDWFNKNHFDYRGLIEKGLAIDATGKNIY